MTKGIERGVPFSEVRVKLGRKVPPWEKVKERIGLNRNNVSPREKYLFRGFYTTQVHILLRRPDLAEEKFKKIEKEGFNEEFEERHASRLNQITRLVRQNDI